MKGVPWDSTRAGARQVEKPAKPTPIFVPQAAAGTADAAGAVSIASATAAAGTAEAADATGAAAAPLIGRSEVLILKRDETMY